MTRAMMAEVQPFWVLIDSTTLMARAIHSIRLWLPVTVLILFLMASCVTMISSVEGDSSISDNAEKIGIIEGRVGNVEETGRNAAGADDGYP